MPTKHAAGSKDVAHPRKLPWRAVGADATRSGLDLSGPDRLHTLGQELRRRATHDTKTGLQNRLAFTTRLGQVRTGEGIECAVLAAAIEDLPEIAEESGFETAQRVVDHRARTLVSVCGLERPRVARIASDPHDLIVLGNQGKGAVRALWSRSPARQLLRRARCPVLVVPGPAMQPATRRSTHKLAAERTDAWSRIETETPQSSGGPDDSGQTR